MTMFILDAAPNVNDKGYCFFFQQGWCPLHYSIKLGKTEVASVLLRHGADMMAKAGHPLVCTLLCTMCPCTLANWEMQLRHDGGPKLMKKIYFSFGTPTPSEKFTFPNLSEPFHTIQEIQVKMSRLN